MDLPGAIKICNTVAHVAGNSGATAIALAGAGLRRGVARPVPSLDGGTLMTPAHLLLHLAYATRFAYERTVLDAYQQWALFRYVGAFDHDLRRGKRHPQLRLSDAARKVSGNQRRVFSEDVGIGMSSVLAREWAESAFGAGVVHLIDFDVALDAGLLHKSSGKRTDYIVVRIDGAWLQLLGLVEAKGSSQAAYTRAQVRKGAAQVEATWGHHAPPLVSLVVATNSGSADMGYIAAEVAPRTPAPSPRFALGSNVAQGLLAGTWAKLADIADDDDLFGRVAPLRLQSRRQREPDTARHRTERRVADRHYEGTEMAIPLPGGLLRVFLGADHQALSELREGDREGAAHALAQAGAIARSRRSLEFGEPTEPSLTVTQAQIDRVQSDREMGHHVEIATEDGVALMLDADA